MTPAWKRPQGAMRMVAALLTALCCAAACTDAPQREEVVIAVAANFAPTLERVARAFTDRTGVRVRPVIGSTGELCAQIEHGAPYHVLLAADAERPRRLEERDACVAGSRFVYARGRLALVGAAVTEQVDGIALLREGAFRHLAIADPEVAPYGVAAREFLESIGLWDAVERRVVYGRDVGQTLQFVTSGAADLGLVALSQARSAGMPSIEVPGSMHRPLVQEAALLLPGRDLAPARQFLEFLRGEHARTWIEEAGYAAVDG